MNTYIVLRRQAWGSGEELAETAERSRRIGAEMGGRVRWIRSYVVEDSGDSLATACVYQASSEEDLREHARRVGMPASEVLPVVDAVIVNDDPPPASA